MVVRLPIAVCGAVRFAVRRREKRFFLPFSPVEREKIRKSPKLISCCVLSLPRPVRSLDDARAPRPDEKNDDDAIVIAGER